MRFPVCPYDLALRKGRKLDPTEQDESLETDCTKPCWRNDPDGGRPCTCGGDDGDEGTTTGGW